jgi:membrane protease YdiL (CAAX protease family)
MTARVAVLERAMATGIALAWIVAFAVVGGAASWLVFQVPAHWAPDWSLAGQSGAAVLGFGFATWLVGRRLDRRSWEALGWRPRTGVTLGLAGGVACGCLMAVGAVGLAVLAGGATVRLTPPESGWGAAAAPLGVGLLLAALAEELMFRGYPLRRLATALGAAPATAAGALGFGLTHLGNPGATAFSTVNVALAGVWLACAFFSPGAMPLAWGAHFGWNATLALGFDAPVSGYAFGVPGIDYRPGAHAWLDGGRFGPEGGIVATLVTLAGAAALVAWTRWARAAPAPA